MTMTIAMNDVDNDDDNNDADDDVDDHYDDYDDGRQECELIMIIMKIDNSSLCSLCR